MASGGRRTCGPATNTTIKRIIRGLLYGVYLSSATLLLLEVTYRFQLIDYYSPELHYLNKDSDLQGSRKPLIAIFGDSFSADLQSYVRPLRASLPNRQILNAAIPGTGIRETKYITRSRLHKRNPHLVIYQIYLGNDLLDLHKPINWRTLSPARNLYWSLSDHIHVISALNYRLAMYLGDQSTRDSSHVIPSNEASFSPELYNAREKSLFQGDPRLLANSLLLQGGYEKYMKTWQDIFRQWLVEIPGRDTHVILLVLPHCAQVSTRCGAQMQRLGADIKAQDSLMQLNPPMLQAIKAAAASDPRVTVLSPLQAMQQAERSGVHLYLNNDPHLSPSGQQWLGRWLYQHIGSYR